MKSLVDKLEQNCTLSLLEYQTLIENRNNQEIFDYAKKKADTIRKRHFHNKIFIRGLIEFTNFCKNDCFYCGIRRSNKNAERYRLSKEDILSSCKVGSKLGIKTFVLQGGEDPFFKDDDICDIISSIKKLYPDSAVTLSIGEKSCESYKAYFDAGADRFLLRHETAYKEHYELLHPKEMSFENRIRCLHDLKEIGYQTGCGFMTSSPFQSAKTLSYDLDFISRLKPQMVGIGPFIPHKDTPFAGYEKGDTTLTLFMLSLVRIMNPYILLPATTALQTADENGYVNGILHGANVIMTNLTPQDQKEKYTLYDNKLNAMDDTFTVYHGLLNRIKTAGFEFVSDRGDYSEKR